MKVALAWCLGSEWPDSGLALVTIMNIFWAPAGAALMWQSKAHMSAKTKAAVTGVQSSVS